MGPSIASSFYVTTQLELNLSGSLGSCKRRWVEQFGRSRRRTVSDDVTAHPSRIMAELLNQALWCYVQMPDVQRKLEAEATD